jgi:hypothetical protein
MNGSAPTPLKRVLNRRRTVTEAPTAKAHKTHMEYQALARALDCVCSMLWLDSLSVSFRAAPSTNLLVGFATSCRVAFNGVCSFGMLWHRSNEILIRRGLES